MATSYDLATPQPPPNPVAKLGVFILVVAAIAAGVWFYISRRTPSDAAPETVTASAEAAPSPAPSPSAQPTPTASPTPTKPGQPAVTPGPGSQPRAGRGTKPGAAMPLVSDPTPAPAPAPSPTAPAPVQPTAQPVSPAPVKAAPSPPPVQPPDPRTYDAAAVDVTPPSLLTPIGIAPIRTNYVPGLATIEVIVSGDGSVLSARAGRPPASLGETLEMMNWLSTAKSWRFGPAVRNGQSVKYRLVVPLSALVSGQGIR